MSLSNLPPGVSSADIERAYGGPSDDPPPPIKCTGCGAFLRRKSDRTEPLEDSAECDGIAYPYQAAYTDGLIDILGEEYRGKTYTEYWSTCGEQATHPRHREIFDAGTVEFRHCRRCGIDSKEVVA
jgi:hypothetical protein